MTLKFKNSRNQNFFNPIFSVAAIGEFVFHAQRSEEQGSPTFLCCPQYLNVFSQTIFRILEGAREIYIPPNSNTFPDWRRTCHVPLVKTQ